MSDLELREAVAREVMGWTFDDGELRHNGELQHIGLRSDKSLLWYIQNRVIPCIPAYEEAMGAAWLVVEKMRELGFRMSIMCWDKDDAETICVEFQRWASPAGGVSKGADAYGEAEAPTTPEAICRAALAAIRSQE